MNTFEKVISFLTFVLTFCCFVVMVGMAGMMTELRNESYVKQILTLRDNVSGVLKQQHERMNAQDRKLDARIKNEREMMKALNLQEGAK